MRFSPGSTSLEDAARHAAERWTGLAVRPVRALGVAQVEADGQSLATAFHELHVVEGERDDPAPRGAEVDAISRVEAEGWALTWLAPTRAMVDLSQRDERLLVEHSCVRARRDTLRGRITAELVPRDRRERWLFVALCASALLWPLAAWAGWLAREDWSTAHVPRVALAALLGGLTSAALRLESDGDTPLLGAAAGAALGTLALLLLASGTLASVALVSPVMLALAFASGFLERALLRRR
jgi:hypothetical protein